MEAIRHRGGLRTTALALAGGVLLSLGAADAASAATCSISGQERTLAPGSKAPRFNHYTLSLSATRTSCTNAKRIVRSYYACRLAKGNPRGTCRRKVRTYSCTERRGRVVSGQFEATVTCKKGRARVVHKYLQFTA